MANRGRAVGKNANHCPECGAFVKQGNLPGHMRKAHGMSEAAARLERSAPRPRRSKARRRLPIWVPVLAAIIAGVVGTGVYVSTLPPPPLTDMCVQHTGGGVHYHVELHIRILGLEYSTVANMSDIGIESSTCYRPVHTHGDVPLVHVELPGRRNVYLRDFFEIWGQPFSSSQIMSHYTDATHRIDFTVNGVPDSSFQDLLLVERQPMQSIVIEYRLV